MTTVRLRMFLTLVCLGLCAAGPRLAAGEAAPAADGSFSGEWHWSKGQEELTLYLVQSSNQLTGWHTAIGQGGQKVDEVPRSDPPSITGLIDGKTATLDFRSGYPDGNGKGKVKLTLTRGYLSWQLLESSGEHYLPKNAKLRRAAPQAGRFSLQIGIVHRGPVLKLHRQST